MKFLIKINKSLKNTYLRLDRIVFRIFMRIFQKYYKIKAHHLKRISNNILTNNKYKILIKSYHLKK